MKKYRIKNGELVTKDGILPRDLLLSDGKIEAIIDRGVKTEDYAELSADGLYVSPGFVDIHQHGGGGADYMDCEDDTYFLATEAHLRHGTTSVLPTTLSATGEAMLKAVKCYLSAKKDPRIRANLLGLHMEGRYISPAQAGAQKPEHISVYDPQEYRAVIEAAEGHLRRWSAAPEVEGAEEFARYATANGITLSIAHSNADFETVLRAKDWGFRHITHLYSCMSSITRHGGFRTAGVLEAAYYLDDMNVEIIADGCHLPPSLLSYVTKFKSPDKIALVTDAMRAAGQDVSESFLGAKDDPLPVIIEDGVAKLTDRSAFGGSIATADRLLRVMVQNGTPLSRAVQMLTESPLEMMQIEVKKGKIQEGFDADLCLFDKDIEVKEVILGGAPIGLKG